MLSTDVFDTVYRIYELKAIIKAIKCHLFRETCFICPSVSSGGHIAGENRLHGVEEGALA